MTTELSSPTCLSLSPLPAIPLTRVSLQHLPLIAAWAEGALLVHPWHTTATPSLLLLSPTLPPSSPPLSAVCLLVYATFTLSRIAGAASVPACVLSWFVVVHLLLHLSSSRSGCQSALPPVPLSADPFLVPCSTPINRAKVVQSFSAPSLFSPSHCSLSFSLSLLSSFSAPLSLFPSLLVLPLLSLLLSLPFFNSFNNFNECCLDPY